MRHGEKEAAPFLIVRKGDIVNEMHSMKRFDKCFFGLLTQNFSAQRETGRKKGLETRLWTVRSPFRG